MKTYLVAWAGDLESIHALVQKGLLDGLEGKVRAELDDIRKHLESSDVHELRHELKQHITEIRVDSQGQIRIEGSLVGALDSVLKLVAGAGLEPATSRL